MINNVKDIDNKNIQYFTTDSQELEICQNRENWLKNKIQELSGNDAIKLNVIRGRMNDAIGISIEFLRLQDEFRTIIME